MKITFLLFFVSIYLITYGQNTAPQVTELEGTTWRDYLCTANKENYKYKNTDIITFYSFKKDSVITTWTVAKNKKDYVANGKWKIENGILIIYKMVYEKPSYGKWIDKWTMKIEKVDKTTLRLWTTCRSELPSWLYVKKAN